MTKGFPPRPPSDRFHEKYVVNPGTGCWLWTASVDRKGYGRFSAGPPDHAFVYAHRWAYAEFVGVIPSGLVVDHMCNTPACVNPEHLQLLTSQQNILRSNHPLIVARWLKRCLRGHDMTDPDNIYVRPDNGRYMCQECQRLRNKRRYDATKAACREDAARP